MFVNSGTESTCGNADILRCTLCTTKFIHLGWLQTHGKFVLIVEKRTNCKFVHQHYIKSNITVLLYAAGFLLFSIMRLIITTKGILLLYFQWFNRAHFDIHFFNSIFLECVYTDLHRLARDFTGGGGRKGILRNPPVKSHWNYN